MKMTPFAKRKSKGVRSCFPTLWWEITAYGTLLNFEHSKEGLFDSGLLWPHRIRYALDNPANARATERDLNWFERCVGPNVAYF